MRIHAILLATLVSPSLSFQRQISSFSTRHALSSSGGPRPAAASGRGGGGDDRDDDRGTSTALWMGKSRKARRMQRVEKSRSKQFFDAIEDASGKKASSSSPGTSTQEKPTTAKDGAAGAGPPPDPAEAERQARNEEARQRMEARPEVSTMIVDEETGIEVVAQGKAVMDVVTRKAVRLSDLGPEYRLAQMFPGVPPQVREKYRVDWKTVDVADMVEALRDACSVKLEDGTRGIPPHPSVSNRAIDFVLANRDYMGERMKRTLGRIQLRSMSLGNKEEALENRKLWKNFCTLENHISAPFRQIVMDAEGRVGPNFGNLDVASYCGGELYERCANYLVLKGMVAHWEKKVVDAEYTERTRQTRDNYMSVLSRGDPRRYLPEPPILFTLKECTQVCYMSQQLVKAFVETPELFDDLPPEVRFLEQALSIKGGTPLRKYMIEEFCPKEQITPEGLREGMRRLVNQLENLQIDPYADITNLMNRLITAMGVGTDDERDPYAVYLINKDPDGPGAFQTYTFNHEKLSLVRFLDNQYKREGATADPVPPSVAGGAFGDVFNFAAAGLGGPPPQSQQSQQEQRQRGGTPANKEEEETYEVPAVRAAGRPHNLGWLKLLDDVDDNDNKRLGQVPQGRIIPDDE